MSEDSERARLRRALRAKRKAVSRHEAQAAARRLLTLARRHGLLAKGRRLGFYLPTEEEIDVLPLINAALWLGRECYLPVLPRRRPGRLWFSRVSERPRWVVNRYGILEHDTPHKRRAHELDVLFVPLVAFDAHGRRLGMGGGYYDFSLAFLRHRRAWRRPKTIGVAYDFQRVARLDAEPWDVPLDAVLTDRAFYRATKEDRGQIPS